jgi:hypothetical protein
MFHRMYKTFMLREAPFGLKGLFAKATNYISLLPTRRSFEFGDVALSCVLSLVSLATYVAGVQEAHSTAVAPRMLQCSV